MVFLDLEDSVAPPEKAGARSQAVRAVREIDWGEKVLCVRVNAWDTQWTYRDIIEVVGQAGPRLDVVMLPKVQSDRQIAALDLLLNQIEVESGLPAGHIGIEAQIETAQGLINVESICSSSPRLETVILGPVDLSASMGMPSLEGGMAIPDYPGDYFHYAFMKILMAGRANNLQVIDGPYAKVKDLDGLKTYSMRSQSLGFDGKWSIHPNQVPVLNEVYSPSQDQFNRAHALLDLHQKSISTTHTGAVMMGDDMLDEASRKAAVTLINKGSRAGMTVTS